MNKLESFIIIAIPYMVLTICLITTYSSLPILFSNIIYGFFTFVIIQISSQMNYNTHQNEYIKRNIITSKNEDLNLLRTALEDVIETRTCELSKVREYEKLRGFFFANISHELRTPLNLIFSSIQILDSNSSLDKHQEKYTKLIKQNCYRLMKTINNIIDLTKLDSNHVEFSPQNSDIVRTVEDITLSVADYASNKGICIVFDTDIEEKIISFDIEKMERIILNLLSNAIKFTERGGDIIVKTYIQDNLFRISVKDTGIGVPPEKISLVFERFVQVDPSIRRRNEGSGIGLSMVKSLVDMHGGKIELQSSLGEGSEFLVSLPLITLPDVDKDQVTIEYQSVPLQRVTIEFSDL